MPLQQWTDPLEKARALGLMKSGAEKAARDKSKRKDFVLRRVSRTLTVKRSESEIAAALR